MRGGCKGGCEQRSEAFAKIQKKMLGVGVGSGASGWEVRVDLNGEVKFLLKFKTLFFFLFFFLGGGGPIRGWGGGGG